MSRLRFLVLPTLAVITPVAVVAGSFQDAKAHAEAPGPGSACSVQNSITQDANGRTMWCNPTMTGDHRLVWQYGGPAEASGPGDPCPTLHATTQDANGRTMWCNPTMTGDHRLVWQYGGPG